MQGRCSGGRDRKIGWMKDTRFAGQLVMDAIRDQASLAKRPRPEYETDRPTVRITVDLAGVKSISESI